MSGWLYGVAFFVVPIVGAWLTAAAFISSGVGGGAMLVASAGLAVLLGRAWYRRVSDDPRRGARLSTASAWAIVLFIGILGLVGLMPAIGSQVGNGPP